MKKAAVKEAVGGDVDTKQTDRGDALKPYYRRRLATHQTTLQNAIEDEQGNADESKRSAGEDSNKAKHRHHRRELGNVSGPTRRPEGHSTAANHNDPQGDTTTTTGKGHKHVHPLQQQQQHHHHHDHPVEQERFDDSPLATDTDTSDSPPHHHQSDNNSTEKGRRRKIKRKERFYNIINGPIVPANTTPVTIRLRHHNDEAHGLVNLDKDSMVFFVIGDWGGPGRDPQKRVAEAMHQVASHWPPGKIGSPLVASTAIPTDGGKKKGKADAAEEETPSPWLDFIVSTGDNMYEDGVADVHDIKLKRNFENVYTQSSIKDVRWYMTLGNHDHGAHGVFRDVMAQVNYTKMSKRWFLPSTYYHQIFNVAYGDNDDKEEESKENVSKNISSSSGGFFTVQMWFLDTYDVSPHMTQMTKTQQQWLEDTLNESKAHWKFIVGHRPVYSAGKLHGSSPYMKKLLVPLMQKHNVSAYFCGDDHQLQVLKDGPMYFALSGAGARIREKDLRPGGVKQTLFQRSVFGFMSVSVTRDEWSLRVHGDDGTVLWDALRIPHGV